jgi:hypothetical protein
MTCKILTADTRKGIHRASVRSASDAPFRNLKADQDIYNSRDEQDVPQVVKNPVRESTGKETVAAEIIFNPEELIRKTLLTETQEDGTRKRIRIAKVLDQQNGDTLPTSEQAKFRCVFDSSDEFYDTLSYAQINDLYSQEHNSEEVVWKFKQIVGHQGPLPSKHPEYKGSTYNVMLEWETGEITSEPLSLIAADDPVTCAIYAKENSLLDTPGWKQFKRLANRHKKMIRMLNQANIKSYKRAMKYMYGFPIPRSYEEAIKFDARNGNHLWDDATALELKQLNEYDTFINLGPGQPIPAGYKKI